MAGHIAIEHADLGFKNFEGREGPYNKSGDRNFVVFLDEKFATELDSDGWNIKWPRPNDNLSPDMDDRRPYLPVSISFDYYPAKVVLVNGESVSHLQEEEVGMLDWAEVENFDLVIRPYNWTVNGNEGIKAYVKALYVTLETDEFSAKYGI